MGFKVNNVHQKAINQSHPPLLIAYTVVNAYEHRSVMDTSWFKLLMSAKWKHVFCAPSESDLHHEAGGKNGMFLPGLNWSTWVLVSNW